MRVRASVSRPAYGWGPVVEHGAVGEVARLGYGLVRVRVLSLRLSLRLSLSLNHNLTPNLREQRVHRAAALHGRGVARDQLESEVD